MLPLPLNTQDVQGFVARLPSPWRVDPKSEKVLASLPASGLADAISMVNLMAIIAEEEGHHPDFFVGACDACVPQQLEVTVFSHSFGGLSTYDFFLVEKIAQKLDVWRGKKMENPFMRCARS